VVFDGGARGADGVSEGAAPLSAPRSRQRRSSSPVRTVAGMGAGGERPPRVPPSSAAPLDPLHAPSASRRRNSTSPTRLRAGPGAGAGAGRGAGAGGQAHHLPPLHGTRGGGESRGEIVSSLPPLRSVRSVQQIPGVPEATEQAGGV